MRLVCCFVVRSSPSVRGGSGARRLFQDVMIAAYSAWGLALGHVGFPVHVWRCRRPFPYGGLDPLRRETSTATVAIHVSGGRCSTRPCAHAIGPSSCSDPVRQQGWLGGHAMTQATPQGEKRSPAPTQPHLCFSRRQVWLNCPMTRTTPRGRRAVRAETAAPVPLASTPCIGRAIGKLRWVGLYCCSFSFVFV